MRIALLGLSHEANTFASQLADEDYFDSVGVQRGRQILDVHAGGTSTMAGFLRALESVPEIEAVPLIMTTLIPRGPITSTALNRYVSDVRDLVTAEGPFDGVLAALHGAAVAQGVLDVDGHLLSMIRELVGPDVVIGTTLDLHANISEEMCSHADILNTYRTNPHVDAHEVAAEVAELVVRAVRGQIQPTMAMVPIPAVINILRQNTDEAPMRDIMADVKDTMTEPGLLSATVAEAYPYADVPEMRMCSVVVTDGDLGRARAAAQRLAERVWARRDAFDAQAPTPIEALERLDLAATTDPVLLLDVGDNIGAGSPGDSVVLLNAARATRFENLLIIVRDAAAVADCVQGGVGRRVSLAIGATAGEATGPPVVCEAEVLALHDGVFETHETVHAGFRWFDAGPSAAVRIDSGQTAILTSRAVLPFSPVQLTTLGLDTSMFEAIVAKGVHSPLAGYGPLVSDVVWVDTPGVTAANLRTLDYQHRPRPLFPFEPALLG